MSAQDYELVEIWIAHITIKIYTFKSGTVIVAVWDRSQFQSLRELRLVRGTW